LGRGTAPRFAEDSPDIRFADIEPSFGVPDRAAVEPLERYFNMRLYSMGFFGPFYYGRGYLDGFNALLLTYPLILWFARAHAVSRGLTALDATAVARGIQVVDRRHGRLGYFRNPIEQSRIARLCERGTLRSLSIWYGT